MANYAFHRLLEGTHRRKVRDSMRSKVDFTEDRDLTLNYARIKLLRDG